MTTRDEWFRALQHPDSRDAVTVELADFLRGTLAKGFGHSFSTSDLEDLVQESVLANTAMAQKAVCWLCIPDRGTLQSVQAGPGYPSLARRLRQARPALRALGERGLMGEGRRGLRGASDSGAPGGSVSSARVDPFWTGAEDHHCGELVGRKGAVEFLV